jgi:nitric oxide reductase subunit B
MVFGFFVMGMLALRTYTDSMPLPEKVVGADGETVYTQADVTAGQQTFLRRGLQQYGSVLGHGGYLGPDYTAEYLRNSAELIEDDLRESGQQDPSEAVKQMFRENRYDEESGTLQFTAEQVTAFESAKAFYGDFFGEDSTKYGLIPNAITDQQEIHELTAFFSWTAWASAAERPGHDYSYTNNWPPEPRVDNTPTADIVVWSGLSLVALLVGLGALFAVYGRWSRNIGWHATEQPALAFRQPGEVEITPAQRVTAGSSSSWRHYSWVRLFWVRRSSIIVLTWPASSVSTSLGCCRSTWRAPGMCSSHCCGPQRPSWPRASSWPRSSPGASRRGSTG